MTNTYIGAFAVFGNNIFAGGSGVFLSTNDGESWNNVSSGLTTAVNSLAVSGTYLFAGTGSGVWRRPLNEMIPNPIAPPASWNFASNTGKNATLGVTTSINPRIGNQSLHTGDAVGVFFLRNDSLICAGYSLWQEGHNMYITAWGDNSQTAFKDGFTEGETIRFKIWDSHAGKEYNATAQYSLGGTMYATDGIYVLSSLVGITSVSHSILLPQGWNMISSFVTPKDSTIDTIFNKINSHIMIVKNGLGLVYWPSLSINAIGNWNRGNGYQIYMQTGDTLTIVGDEIDPQLMPLTLAQGWSMISYLRNSPIRADSALGTLGSNLVIIKNG